MIRKAVDHLRYFMLGCTIDRVSQFVFTMIAGGLYDEVQRMAKHPGREAPETSGIDLDHLVQRDLYRSFRCVDQFSFS